MNREQESAREYSFGVAELLVGLDYLLYPDMAQAQCIAVRQMLPRRRRLGLPQTKLGRLKCFARGRRRRLGR